MPLVTSRELAETLGVTVSTVWRWARTSTGPLNPVDIGSTEKPVYRWKLSDIETLVRGSQNRKESSCQRDSLDSLSWEKEE